MDIEEIMRTITQRKYHILEMKLNKYDLVKGQADLLLLIRDNDGVTQNELAQMLGIKDSTISVRLSTLEKRNYIVREINKDNLKRKNVYITEEGRKVSIQCRRILREFEEQMYKGFTKKEKKQLEESLNKLINNLSKKV